MPFQLNIPRNGVEALTLDVEVGQIVFALGANGAGKSSLMHALYSQHIGRSRRISAHRQTWLHSGSITISAHERRNTESNIQNMDANPQSRWMDHWASQRTSLSIYDLIDSENIRAREIANAVDSSDIDLAKILSKKDSPIAAINELLRLSNLPIEISIHHSEQVMASRFGGTAYPISELSDGERNAILIAADVLTAKTNTIIFIDEPERHLHRSIVSPLLTLLFAKRNDCAFVISTHDALLPMDNPTAKTLLVRGCTYAGSASVSGWDVDLLETSEEIDDSILHDILGSRRKIIFVEGNENSLDKPLYSIIFPQTSILPKNSCRDVEQSVLSIRQSEGLHWLRVFGIIDNDRRNQDEIDDLANKGVYAISTYSVESIYYHPEIQVRIAKRSSDLVGEDYNATFASAKNAAIAAIRPHILRLSERAVERSIRHELMQKLPKRTDITASLPIEITIDIPAIVSEETRNLTEACDRSDFEYIVNRYPVRETPALSQLSDKLGFKNTKQYESAVRRMLMDDASALTFVRGLFGALPSSLD